MTRYDESGKVVTIVPGETILIGGAFTDHRRPPNDGGYTDWSDALQAWRYFPPRPQRTPRRYYPSSMAHRP